ncbi:G-protein coupled receptor Mth2-like [Achroia grisella]|uniref:G-protein coupled receptor Mth2-like n=1 Tax=Achroia grisella TaxID=688607 RepID=UPI0027D244AE|nr:G-protein coupled receptor Mth2-like [Achroia grisella]
MGVLKYYILFLFLNSVISEEINCDDLRFIDSNDTVIDKEYCKIKPCIITQRRNSEGTFPCIIVSNNNKSRKYKSFKSVLANTTDIQLLRLQDVYKSNYKQNKMEKSNKTFEESFNFVRLENNNVTKQCFSNPTRLDYDEHIPYFLENGSMLLDSPNTGTRFRVIDNYNFTLIFYVKYVNDTAHSYAVIRFIKEDENLTDTKDVLVAVGMLISSFFMILVIVVYGLLKELQNLFGYVMIAYMATFSGAFLLQATKSLGLRENIFDNTVCLVITPLVNFGIISSFMWMNVMSFDIWWTFRGTHYGRRINRHGIRHKFMCYGLYAWVLPAILVVIEVVIDNKDLKHLPNFIKPSFGTCSFSDNSRMTYLLAPILVILLVNILLFGLTAFNMWRVRRDLSRFDKNITKNNKKNENRFALYLKLSVVMGINWIFEVLGAYKNLLPQWFEHIVDAYNVLIGVLIFFVFVFKSSILLKICKRLRIKNNFTDYLENRVTTKGNDRKATRSSNSSVAVSGVPSINMMPMN